MSQSLSQTSHLLGQSIVGTKTIVQKYGGTSVATPSSRQLVCNRIQAAQACGYSVLVVISAMGRKGAPYATDTLLSLVDGTAVSPRERDLLFSCGEIIAGIIQPSCRLVVVQPFSLRGSRQELSQTQVLAMQKFLR